MSRARVVLAVVILILSSGCIGFVTGDEPLAFESSPATVSHDALEETGYGNENVREMDINRTVTVENTSRDVELTNWMAAYSKSAGVDGVSEQKYGQFMVVTTPAFKIMGENLNPIGRLSNEQLLTYAGDQYNGVRDIKKVKSESRVFLGSNTRVDKYRATVDAGDASVDIYLMVTKVEHNGDYVISVAGYPVQVDEEGDVYTLMENVQHDSE